MQVIEQLRIFREREMKMKMRGHGVEEDDIGEGFGMMVFEGHKCEVK